MKASAPHYLDPHVDALVDAHHEALEKFEWLARYAPHVLGNRATRDHLERQIDDDPASASAALNALYVTDEAHRRLGTGPYAGISDGRHDADLEPNITGIAAFCEVEIDGRVELRTRTQLERIAKQLERNRTPVVLGSHDEDASVVGHVVSAWVEHDELHFDAAVSDVAHHIVQHNGMDAASLKYTYTPRVDSDGDLLQENHQIEHVALVARSRARNPGESGEGDRVTDDDRTFRDRKDFAHWITREYGPKAPRRASWVIDTFGDCQCAECIAFRRSRR